MVVSESRHTSTIIRFFRENIEGSIIKTYVYPSYPNAVNEHNSRHVVVNHSNFFTNDDSDHTNTVESMWTDLKIDIKVRRGVMLSNLKEYIQNYVDFDAIKPRDRKSLIAIFVEMIKKL